MIRTRNYDVFVFLVFLLKDSMLLLLDCVCCFERIAPLVLIVRFLEDRIGQGLTGMMVFSHLRHLDYYLS